MRNPHGIDVQEIIRNAEKEGIDLSEITLFYSDLNAAEQLELKRHNLITTQSGARIIGRFNSEGLALFPDKITEVYYLGS